MVCKTCNGTGLVSYFEFTAVSPGYVVDPCPDCGVDQYGNPVNGDRLIYCCFPDCGCDGARLCTAENEANYCATVLNIEHRKAKI